MHPGWRGQVVALNCERQSEHGYCDGKQSQSSNQQSVTCQNIRHWLVNHDEPRSKIDRKPIKFLFDLYIQVKWTKVLTQTIKTDSHSPSIHSQPWDSLQTQNSLNKGKAVSSWGRISIHYQTFVLLIFLPAFQKRTNGCLPLVTVHWGKGNNQTFQGLLDTGSELTLIPGNSRCQWDSLEKDLWEWGAQWNWSSDSSTSGSRRFLNPSCACFPSFRMYNWNRHT